MLEAVIDNSLHGNFLPFVQSMETPQTSELLIQLDELNYMYGGHVFSFHRCQTDRVIIVVPCVQSVHSVLVKHFRIVSLFILILLCLQLESLVLFGFRFIRFISRLISFCFVLFSFFVLFSLLRLCGGGFVRMQWLSQRRCVFMPCLF